MAASAHNVTMNTPLLSLQACSIQDSVPLRAVHFKRGYVEVPVAAASAPAGAVSPVAPSPPAPAAPRSPDKKAEPPGFLKACAKDINEAQASGLYGAIALTSTATYTLPTLWKYSLGYGALGLGAVTRGLGTFGLLALPALIAEEVGRRTTNSYARGAVELGLWGLRGVSCYLNPWGALAYGALALNRMLIDKTTAYPSVQKVIDNRHFKAGLLGALLEWRAVARIVSWFTPADRCNFSPATGVAMMQEDQNRCGAFNMADRQIFGPDHELFPSGGPTPFGVNQADGMNDCYALAAFGAVSHRAPETVLHMLDPLQNGTYNAHFFDTINRVWRTINVEANVYRHVVSNFETYAKMIDTDGNGLYESGYSLLERALAKFNSFWPIFSAAKGYDGIGDVGNSASLACAVLTGGTPGFFNSPVATVQQIIDFVAYKPRSCLVAAAMDQGGLGQHAYSVLEALSAEVRLYDPFRGDHGRRGIYHFDGTDHWYTDGDSVPPGEIRMSYDLFQRMFQGICYAEPSPAV